MAMSQVFTAIIVDTDSGALLMGRGPINLTVLAAGTFGSGTLTVQISPDDGTTFIDADAGLTAAGKLEVNVPDESQVRLRLTGSTAASVNAWANFPIPAS